MTEYQVVAECCLATLDGPSGRFKQLLYKGALVPSGAPELKLLLADGFIAEVPKGTGPGLDSDGIPDGARGVDVPAGLTTTPVEKSAEQRKAEQEASDKAKADAELADKRAAAKAKLPEDGSAPDGRASKDVLVEYLAANGYDYDELAKQDPAALKGLAKQVAEKPQS